jgi:hypothetical protein
MNSKILLLSLICFALFYTSYSNRDCIRYSISGRWSDCGTGCTGRPLCFGRKCIDEFDRSQRCYCDCTPYMLGIGPQCTQLNGTNHDWPC